MAAIRKQSFQPDYAIPPGETLREIMEAQSMTIESLAARIGMEPRSLHRIFTGSQPIVPGTSVRLEMVFGIPASFWNNLQAQYAEACAKQEEKMRLEAELRERKDWMCNFPISLMKKRGYIPDSKDATEAYRGLLAFFGISSGDTWAEIWDSPSVAARRSGCFESSKWHASVWIRQGERLASKIACAPYDAGKFKMALQEIRKLTIETPNSFVDKMRELCANAGVALALVPEITKVPWNGATKWMQGNPVIILTLRGKGEDTFWFSFFHEASHVLHDDKRSLHIADNSNDKAEKKADSFAAELLIPVRYNQRIAEAKSEKNIKVIAQELGITPGIVAGRFRHLTRKWNWHASLIRRFEWREA